MPTEKLTKPQTGKISKDNVSMSKIRTLMNKDKQTIEINNGTPTPVNEKCIECGHCEAICPVGAIKLAGYDDEVIEFDNDTRLNPDVLMNAIRTRRTIRTFEDKEVPEEIVDMILEAGRLAPTGGNGQRTSFVILKDKKIEEIKEICNAI